MTEEYTVDNPRFPNVVVELSGTDGNSMAILSKARRALRSGGASLEECDEFVNEALSGDYDNVLQTCMRWMQVE